MDLVAKQDVHCWKEITCIFITFYFKRKESTLTGVIQWSFRCEVSCFPRPSLFMSCEERHNLCMNGASLYRESLDRVPWSKTTPAKLNKANAVVSKISHCLDQKLWKQFTMLYSNHIYIIILWFGHRNLTLQNCLSYKKRDLRLTFFFRRDAHI